VEPACSKEKEKWTDQKILVSGSDKGGGEGSVGNGGKFLKKSKGSPDCRITKLYQGGRWKKDCWGRLADNKGGEYIGLLRKRIF